MKEDPFGSSSGAADAGSVAISPETDRWPAVPTGRPASAVSTATGLVGLVGLAAATLLLTRLQIGVFWSSIVLLLATALPMVIWAMAVEKVYLNPTTGLDFSRPRRVSETLETTRVKLVGLFAIWTVIAVIYGTIKTYTDPRFDFYFLLLLIGCVPLVILAPIYLFCVDRYMRAPHDGLWHTGRWVLCRPADRDKVADHLRGWAIKAFFLAFMFSVLPRALQPVLHADAQSIAADPVAAALLAIKLMFLVDACFGTVGYMLTFRPFDSHIRSANPYLGAWLTALACYPPFIVMGAGGPFDYRAGTESWLFWFAGNDLLLVVWGTILVALAAFYAWATLVFGIRFSNLTHRGIITHGPYRYVKHPAYLSKNLFWWLTVLPFLPVEGGGEALRSSFLLLSVNAIYYLRAKTEERHLRADPDYCVYADWVAEHGVFSRARRAVLGPSRSYDSGHEPSPGQPS